MRPLPSDKLALDLLAILGIDSTNVRALTLRLEVGQPAVLDVEHALPDALLDELASVFEQFEFTIAPRP